MGFAAYTALSSPPPSPPPLHASPSSSSLLFKNEFETAANNNEAREQRRAEAPSTPSRSYSLDCAVEDSRRVESDENDDDLVLRGHRGGGKNTEKESLLYAGS